MDNLEMPKKTNWIKIIGLIIAVAFLLMIGYYLFGLPPELQKYIPVTNTTTILTLRDVCREIVDHGYSHVDLFGGAICVRNTQILEHTEATCICYNADQLVR